MCTYVKLFIFNMLKLLLICCIFHLLKYIETHAAWCFLIILEWFNEFFYIFEIINIYK
jgi:hypothetical protein